MKAAQLYGAGTLRVDDKPAPAIGPHDVLLQVAACGICGSDQSFLTLGSFFGPDTPMPLGHEFSGTVVATGNDVTGVAIGQRVVANPMTEAVTIGCGSPDNGAFAEFVRVPCLPARPALHPIPDLLSADIAALCEPIAVGSHAVTVSGIQRGEKLVIYGAGPVGLGALVRAHYLGIDDITVVDFSDLRLGIARQLGASRTHNPATGKTGRFLREQLGVRSSPIGSGIAADAFIEATGAAPAIQEIIKLAGPGTRIAVAGMHKGAVAMDLTMVMAKELQLLGSIGYPHEFADVVSMVCQLNETLRPMISHHFPLAAIEEAFATSMDPHRAVKVIIHCQPA